MGDETVHLPEEIQRWCVRKIENKIKYEPKNARMLFKQTTLGARCNT